MAARKARGIACHTEIVADPDATVTAIVTSLRGLRMHWYVPPA